MMGYINLSKHLDELRPVKWCQEKGSYIILYVIIPQS